MTTNALAQDLPHYNVQYFCETEGVFLYFTDLNGCISTEQKYYDDLTRKWPTIQTEIRSKCIDDFVGLGNYGGLQNCIEQAMKVPEPIKKFRY